MQIFPGTSSFPESSWARTNRSYSLSLSPCHAHHALTATSTSNPKVYLGALQHLSVPPSKCVLVAAHIGDLRHAASHGMKTVYVRRSTEEPDVKDTVKTKANGGEVDMVVDSILELAELIS